MQTRRQPSDDDNKKADKKDPDDPERGGFSLGGPFGFFARFPQSAAWESRWVIRAIAVAIVVLALCYGWSLML